MNDYVYNVYVKKWYNLFWTGVHLCSTEEKAKKEALQLRTQGYKTLVFRGIDAPYTFLCTNKKWCFEIIK